jgi:alpha-N-arabinofuranosidase
MDKGTSWSDLRREHGIEKPHNVKWWCLGNEMDGPWQIGHMPAREYGRKARDAGRQMRIISRDLQLIACGSSNNRMPTYPDWDRETLEECYDQVDGLSLHRYYGNDWETGGDTARFLAMNLDMDIQIKETAGVCDYVRALTRSRKTLWLSFDEWNVWYRARGGEHADGKRQEAPKLLEEIYNLEDALLVGGLMNTLVRNCDRVRVACLAQLINVIGPIFTNPDGFFRQTIYYPYVWMLQHARGEALRLAVESPTYDVEGFGPTARFGPGARGQSMAVPYIDAAATRDPATGEVALFFLNRDLDKAREVELVWRETPLAQVSASQTLTGTDLKAVNSFDQPNRVSPQAFTAPKVGDRMKLELPPRSYTVLHFTNA